MSITNRQKQPENLELLKAFSVQYNKAKSIRQLRMFVSFIFALVVPFIVLNNSNLKDVFSIIGGGWAARRIPSFS